jgi:hypothetical protein
MTHRQEPTFRVLRENIEDSAKNFLAIIIIMSKAKYMICGCGNGSLWTIYYRENKDNFHQFVGGKWV